MSHIINIREFADHSLFIPSLDFTKRVKIDIFKEMAIFTQCLIRIRYLNAYLIYNATYLLERMRWFFMYRCGKEIITFN